MKPTFVPALFGLLASIALAACKSTTPASQTATTEVSGSTLVAPTTAAAEPTVIKFARDSVTRIVAGTQTSTTRKGIRHYPLGPAIMQSGDEKVQIEITDLKFKKFSELTDADAKTDGFATLSDLQDSLRKSFPDIVDADDTTTVYLRVPTH